MVSLGKQIAGVWTDNDDLAKELEDVSKATGDKSWRMPMAKEYNEQLESKIADLKNCGTRYGGAITAALFLQNFVSKKKPFAHIDIAGPVSLIASVFCVWFCFVKIIWFQYLAYPITLFLDEPSGVE